MAAQSDRTNTQVGLRGDTTQVPACCPPALAPPGTAGMAPLTAGAGNHSFLSRLLGFPLTLGAAGACMGKQNIKKQ